MQNSKQFIVARDDLQRFRIVETELPDLNEHALLVRVDRFAFTANNITYALLGDSLKYWQLFPAPEGFGNIPVWGFGEVVDSRHADVAIGEILFGYFPMATHLVIEAGRVDKHGLRDVAAHRQGVSPVYNAYTRVSGNSDYEGRNGDYQALLRPLFMLSFLVDDYLREAKQFGAARVVLSSASSKTAFGLAHLLSQRGIPVVGLTSSANAEFVRGLGCYSSVVDYDDLESLDPAVATAFVDMAGNARLRKRLHQHLGDRLVYSARIGLTHQDTTAEAPEALPGAAPAWFFAPDQIRRLYKEWGAAEFDARFANAFSGLRPLLDRCLTVVRAHGNEAVAEAYKSVLDGRASPAEGHVVSLA